MKQYFLSVICSAILCGIVTGFLEKKGASGKILKLICGAFLTFTVIRPIADVRLDEFSFFTDQIMEDAAYASELGENRSREAMASIIKLETEAYILDKASLWEEELTVTVTLDEELIPCGAVLTGVLPKSKMAEVERILEEDLGIPKEEQIWNGS